MRIHTGGGPPPDIPTQVPCGDVQQIRCAGPDPCASPTSCPGHTDAVCVQSFCSAPVPFAGHTTSSACVGVWVDPATREAIPECGGLETYGGSGNPIGTELADPIVTVAYKSQHDPGIRGASWSMQTRSKQIRCRILHKRFCWTLWSWMLHSSNEGTSF